MEGKTVIVRVLIMTLVMAQIHADAKINCPAQVNRDIFDACQSSGKYSLADCVALSGCTDVSGSSFPPGYPKDIIENSADTAVNEYCKLGCAVSKCGGMITLQNTDANEIVNGAIEKCTKACSSLCKKGSPTAVKST